MSAFVIMHPVLSRSNKAIGPDKMAPKKAKQQPFNIMIVGQAGRLQYEAVLFMASLRAMTPDFAGRVIVAEPQPGPKWDKDPRMSADIREVLLGLGAEIAPFESAHFGQS
jgi:hypothetical protein